MVTSLLARAAATRREPRQRRDSKRRARTDARAPTSAGAEKAEKSQEEEEEKLSVSVPPPQRPRTAEERRPHPDADMMESKEKTPSGRGGRWRRGWMLGGGVPQCRCAGALRSGYYGMQTVMQQNTDRGNDGQVRGVTDRRAGAAVSRDGGVGVDPYGLHNNQRGV